LKDPKKDIKKTSKKTIIFLKAPIKREKKEIREINKKI
jgi:hypothetical protein